MNTILTTDQFDAWLHKLKDATTKFRIIARIRMAGLGNFGDCASVGKVFRKCASTLALGIASYIQEGDKFYLILGGGDRSSQKRDIAAVKDMARRRREEV